MNVARHLLLILPVLLTFGYGEEKRQGERFHLTLEEAIFSHAKPKRSGFNWLIERSSSENRSGMKKRGVAGIFLAPQWEVFLRALEKQKCDVSFHEIGACTIPSGEMTLFRSGLRQYTMAATEKGGLIQLERIIPGDMTAGESQVVTVQDGSVVYWKEPVAFGKTRIIAVRVVRAGFNG